MVLNGIPAAPGIAIGTAFVLREDAPGEPQHGNRIAGAEEETARLDKAIAEAERELAVLVARGKKDGDAAGAGILNSHLCILRDPEITDEAKRRIAEENQTAEAAITEAIRETAEIFAEMDDDPYLQERARDIEDVGRRILRKLSGKAAPDLSNLPPDTIVVAQELKPSDTATLDRKHVIGFATDSGGATSHTAILAKAAGLVAVVGSGSVSASVRDGDIVIVDGTIGLILINPDRDTQESYRMKRDEYIARVERQKRLIGEPCVTRAGKRVVLAANIGGPQDVDRALANGAEAIGLFRTEFLFLDRDTAPDEEEQFAAYKAVLERMGGKPVIVRTLDIGGDKEVPYLGLPREDNPFLGARALRLCFMRPELFRTQVKALLRAAAFGNLEIMFPMVQSVGEIEKAKAIMAECAEELAAAGIDYGKDIRVGIMIEIPAAAIISGELARHCDFFSIGTNDLTQYTLAADRGNQSIAGIYDPFHPAVLSLIRTTIEAAHANGIPCGMCGEFAGNPEAIPRLVDYGLDEFSMSASLLPAAREIIMTRECCGRE
jgi:phosphotransferase system enzyme I (PtsI)